MTPAIRRALRRRPLRSTPAVDATREPDPGPAPEAVFDRVTGPYLRRTAWALPGVHAHDEDA